MSLHKIQQHIQGASKADRITQGFAALVKFTIGVNSTLNNSTLNNSTLNNSTLNNSTEGPTTFDLLQVQALSTYSQCAVIITTTMKQIDFSTEQSILCLGADGSQTVKVQLYAQKFWGAFASVIENYAILIILLGSIDREQRQLHWQHFEQNPSSSTLTGYTLAVLKYLSGYALLCLQTTSQPC